MNGKLQWTPEDVRAVRQILRETNPKPFLMFWKRKNMKHILVWVCSGVTPYEIARLEAAGVRVNILPAGRKLVIQLTKIKKKIQTK